MINYNSFSAQRGVATIFVAMILLILITLMVVTAYSLSNVNLKSVGNMQSHKEAIASADKAIEIAIDGTFWNPPIAQEIPVDVDRDDVDDFVVTIDSPTCLRAAEAILSTASSVTLPGFSSASAWNTMWVLDATAINDTSGTRVRVRQGVRVLMSETDKNLYCPT